MAANSNKRIAYASEQVNIAPDGSSTYAALHGVQSCGMSANFNLSQIFELGQSSLYENIEDIPNLEVTMSKVLDGYPLIYHEATRGSTTTAPTLLGRSASQCSLQLGIFPDTNDSATGTPASVAYASGLFISTHKLTFPVGDSCTEECTLVGNHRVWKNDPKYAGVPTITMTGNFTSNNDSPIGAGGVQRRENITFTHTGSTLDTNGMCADVDCTVLPPEVWGISSSGTNEKSNGTDFDCHLQNMSVNVNLGREAINELGRFAPYTRYLKFPVEVSSEFEAIATSGDMISFTEAGILSTDSSCTGQVGNLRNRTIRIATCDGTRVYLGVKNKLSSINYNGGDTGGGNASVTYSFSNFNNYTVMQSGDPHASGSAWWTSRTTYLRDL